MTLQTLLRKHKKSWLSTWRGTLGNCGEKKDESEIVKVNRLGWFLFLCQKTIWLFVHFDVWRHYCWWTPRVIRRLRCGEHVIKTERKRTPFRALMCLLPGNWSFRIRWKGMVVRALGSWARWGQWITHLVLIVLTFGILCYLITLKCFS